MNPIRASHAFRFVTQMNLTQLTGTKVRDLPSLLQQLKIVPASVIHYHTHHFLKQHQSLSPEPPNDFAYWTSNILQEEGLGEQLAAIDIVRFSSLQDIREKLISVITTYLARTSNTRVVSAGSELHLMKSFSVILPTPYEAWTLREFSGCLGKISLDSLYHHMFEARLRLGKGINDFSAWLNQELKEKELAGCIERLDPYTQTLEGLRACIVRLIERRLKTASPEKALAS